MDTAWAYIRVSTTKDQQELSLEEQERWARSYASEKGVGIKIFSERASAKSTVGRKVFQSMVAELETLTASKRPKLLLITSIDRLSRDMTDTLVVMRTLRALKVGLYSRDQGLIKGDTFADRAALVGQSMGGEAENENRSLRMKASWERRQREGKPKSNKVPYGLQLIAERDVALPESGSWVKKAFKWYSEGVGSPTIATRLKEGAPPHIVRRSNPDGSTYDRVRHPVWEYNRVLKMLRQPRYRGTLVDPQLFDRVQKLLKTRPRIRQLRKFEYPLSGAFKCSDCGRSLHGHATGGNTTARRADGRIVRYRHNRLRYYSCYVCGYHLNADRLEDKFKNEVGDLRADDSVLREWVFAKSHYDGSDAKVEIAALERKLDPQVIEKQRAATWEPFYQGAITQDQLRAQLDRLDSRVIANRQRLMELHRATNLKSEAKRTYSEARLLLKNFWHLYSKASYERRRQIVAALVAAIGRMTVNRDGEIRFVPHPPS